MATVETLTQDVEAAEERPLAELRRLRAGSRSLGAESLRTG